MALKRKEILIHATTWMNPEDRLHGINHTQEDKCYVVPALQTESSVVAARCEWRTTWEG